MAAMDTFRSFLASLTPRERDSLQDLVHDQESDLLAARSEDARVRLVNDFIRVAHESLPPHKKHS